MFLFSFFKDFSCIKFADFFFFCDFHFYFIWTVLPSRSSDNATHLSCILSNNPYFIVYTACCKCIEWLECVGGWAMHFVLLRVHHALLHCECVMCMCVSVSRTNLTGASLGPLSVMESSKKI